MALIVLSLLSALFMMTALVIGLRQRHSSAWSRLNQLSRAQLNTLAPAVVATGGSATTTSVGSVFPEDFPRSSRSRVSQINTPIDWSKDAPALQLIASRLGRSGFLSERQQRFARTGIVTIFVITGMATTLVGYSRWGVVGAAAGAGVGVYSGILISLLLLKRFSKELSRQVMFHTPLVLESLILLVESGLGILPAISQLVANERKVRASNPVTYLLGTVYDLAANGMPLGQALSLVANSCDQRVIRHVLLHLDISGNEGGELVPSLRNLSSYAHTEWRLSVEHRVRRLENLVVFPVFVSVMGLLLLTAAVPMVPVLKLSETLSRGSPANSLTPVTGMGAR